MLLWRTSFSFCFKLFKPWISWLRGRQRQLGGAGSRWEVPQEQPGALPSHRILRKNVCVQLPTHRIPRKNGYFERQGIGYPAKMHTFSLHGTGYHVNIFTCLLSSPLPLACFISLVCFRLLPLACLLASSYLLPLWSFDSES